MERHQIHIPEPYDEELDDDELDAALERVERAARQRRGRIERGNGFYGTQ